MADTLTVTAYAEDEGEGTVQTSKQLKAIKRLKCGSESCSGTHNPKVHGSNPCPATK